MVGFAHKPIIRGERVCLRPLEIGDAPSMWADLQDEDATRLTGTHESFTRDQIDRWCATRMEHDDRLDLAVVDADTGQWAGEIVVNDWDPANRSCGLRIALSASARGRGLGTEATRLLVDYLFTTIDDPPVNRVSLEVFAFNTRAVATYRRVGFRREGTLRQALYWEGEFHDAIVMSIIRSDSED